MRCVPAWVRFHGSCRRSCREEGIFQVFIIRYLKKPSSCPDHTKTGHSRSAQQRNFFSLGKSQTDQNHSLAPLCNHRCNSAQQPYRHPIFHESAAICTACLHATKHLQLPFPPVSFQELLLASETALLIVTTLCFLARTSMQNSDHLHQNYMYVLKDSWNTFSEWPTWSKSFQPLPVSSDELASDSCCRKNIDLR